MPRSGALLRADRAWTPATRSTTSTTAFAHFVGEDASFSLVAGEPTEHLHLAFGAADNRAVQEFHRAAVDAGYRDNGPAGERAVYHAGYYGAFVLDPDGNNIEVVNHNR